VFLREPGTVIRVVLLAIGLPTLLIGLYLYRKRSRALGRPIGLGASLRRMSRRRAVTLALFLLVCGVAMEFFPETLALLWHIRHSRIVTFSNNAGTFEIPVPTWWYGRDMSDPSSLMLVTASGRFRGMHLKKPRWGAAFFSESRFSISEAEKHKLMAQLNADQRKIMSQTEAQFDDLFGSRKPLSKLFIAGQPTECFERTSPRFTNLVVVECEPGAPLPGLSVLFSGHPSSVPEFLRLLQLVRKKS